MTTKPTNTWPPNREPQTDTERREWLHTHPDRKLCECNGSGLYHSADGFELFECPHHEGTPLGRALDIEADLLADELVGKARAELNQARNLAVFALLGGCGWCYLNAMLTAGGL